VKKKLLAAAAGLAAASFVLAACGGDDDSAPSAAERTGTLNVWLMQDASGEKWAPIVTQATTLFNKKYPKVQVKVTTLQWVDGQQRLTTAFAGNTPPDVAELGNTWTSGFAGSGALADLTPNKDEFPNSETWLKSLQDAGTYNGKVYGVPYYAGSRVITYRKDMFTQAGITAPPTSMDELKADADKLNAKFASKIKNFSAFYIPGQHWYLAGTLIADQGVAQPWAEFTGGKWTANVNSPESMKGLDLFKELQSKYSKADPRGEEADQAYRMGGQKNIAMFYGAAWELGEVGNKDKGGDPKMVDKLAQFALPSINAGQTAPAFLGGSHLSIPVKSKQQDLAREWISAYTNTAVQTSLVNNVGVIPNTTTLLSLKADDPSFKASQKSWFVPTSKNWASVEGQRILQNTLVDISTGKKSVQDAANTATQQIQEALDRM
jgi:N,N'-diacetylchitobiose transport system substrate-binding protein